MSENDFDGQLSSYLDALPRDEYGQPVIGIKDLRFVRKASSVANGVQLLESLSEQWLALEATKGIKQATVAERRGHLNKLLTYLGDDARPTDLTKTRAVGFVEEALNRCRWVSRASSSCSPPAEDLPIGSKFEG